MHTGCLVLCQLMTSDQMQMQGRSAASATTNTHITTNQGAPQALNANDQPVHEHTKLRVVGQKFAHIHPSENSPAHYSPC
jgi:hypothetical protein